MVDLVPFCLLGNGLCEMGQWEMGFGWLRLLRSIGIGNDLERGNFEGNLQETSYIGI
jgi:hypothetical protein